MVTCIIAARASSKALPGKNLRTVGGITLLGRCIRTCHDAVEDVLVTTEDEDIAAEARLHGARIHRRPMELAADGTTSEEMVRDALRSTAAEIIVFAQCTAPLMTSGDIRRSLEKLAECDLAFAVHKSHQFLLTKDGRPVNWTIPLPMRQDFEPQYAISGSCFAFRREYADQILYTGRLGLVLSEHPLRLDIDSETDLWLAEQVLR
jgi:CMP-N-acetylneuraminic acid synthetase